MLKIDRQEQIMKILKERGSVLVTELSDIFSCSNETIRRDLNELDQSNLITRTHGGAFFSEKHDKTYPFGIRNILFEKEKELIAKEAVKLINNNDVIFLDSSTTCLQLAKEIINNKIIITIITNSIQVANLCLDSINEVDLVLIGGSIRKYASSTIGPDSLDQISKYFVDTCFISPPKVTINFGLSDNNRDEGKIKESMIGNSKKAVLLADHTKFDENANILISSLDNIDVLITDSDLQDEWKDYLEIYPGLDVVIAKN